MHSKSSASASSKHKPCQQFSRTGRCHFGAKCKYSHQLQVSQPCSDFARHGYCKYGSTCKFLHDEPATRAPRQKQQPPQQPLHVRLKDAEINSDASLETPLIVKQLCEEPETEYVITTLHQSQWFASLPNKCAAVPFDTVLAPMLQLCTCSAVVHSARQDQVQWLYLALHEANLAAASPPPKFQRFVVYALDDACCYGAAAAAGGGGGPRVVRLDMPQSVVAVVNFFCQVAERFSKDMGHPFYLQEVVPVLTQHAKTHAQQVLDRVEKIARICGDNAWVTMQSGYRLPARPPARPPAAPLSGGPGVLRQQQGGAARRHDNDHVHFADISIIPTTQELAYDEPDGEYTPENRLGAYHHLVHDTERCYAGGEGGGGEDKVALNDQRLLDTHFRLLRQDFVLPLKSAVQEMRLQQGNKKQPRLRRNTALNIVSLTAVALVREVPFARGLRVQFTNPLKNKQEWTTNMHRRWFGQGGLVAIERDNEIELLAQVVDRSGLEPAKEGGGDATNTADTFICICSLSPQENDVLLALAVGATAGAKKKPLQIRHVLDDFFAYRPVLTALQATKKLPFAGLLSGARRSSGNDGGARRPPAFISKLANTTLDLTCLLLKQPPAGVDGGPALAAQKQLLTRFPVHLLEASGADGGLMGAEFAPLLRVDANQLRAIVTTLTSEVSLIQGPPGTGKSYCGALLVHILLDSFPVSMGGPILCLCTTNHALDQFVEDVLEGNNKLRVVRLGARSKNPRMEEYGLRAQLKTRTRTSNANYFAYKDKLKLMEQLRYNELSWLALQDYVRQNLVELYDHIQGFSREGEKEEEAGEDENRGGGGKFIKVKPKSRAAGKEDALFHWIQAGPPALKGKKNRYFSSEQGMRTLAQVDFAALNREERRILVNAIRVKLLKRTFDEYAAVHEAARLSDDDDKLAVLHHAQLVAATTSKAAEVQHLIRALKPKVLIMEEAGEVLEAHTLAALHPNLEQLILIGDHQQLRPKPQHFPLSIASNRGVNMDVSMFERLMKDEHHRDVPRTVLEAQRRMRPEIADFTRLTYPSLTDAGGVFDYPAVVGTQRNVVFFDHHEPEDGHQRGHQHHQDDHVTKCNTFEAKLVARFALYLLQQGYGKDQVAIIVPYTGQLAKVRSELQLLRCEIELNEQDQQELDRLQEDGGDGVKKKAGAGATATAPPPRSVEQASDRIRLATVDNFQGEEADVILFSTVRSPNEKNNSIGFLKEDNRVNVALSRARHGMFLFGQLSFLETKTPMWKRVVGLARQQNALQDHIELRCKNHDAHADGDEGDVVRIRSAEDFGFIPDGGCRRKCDARLGCGHACPLLCHPASHNSVQCNQPCDRRCARGHACAQLCRDACKCRVPVPEGELPVLACGHVAQSPLYCYQLDELSSSVRCVVQVRVVLPCQHSVLLPCHNRFVLPKCKVPCGASVTGCGHPCQNPHVDCDGGGGGTSHACGQKCTRKQSCSHACEAGCGHAGPCPPCQRPCETKCAHSKCKLKCCEPCSPCMQVQGCAWQCEHHVCNLPCGVPCERPLCDLPCSKRLRCGHACPSLCGEPCPLPHVACRQCVAPMYLNAEVDLLEHKTLAEWFASEDGGGGPIITLPCNHSWTVESLDGWMGLSALYNAQDGTPLSAGLKFGAMEHKACPLCRGTMASVRRYSRLTNRVSAGLLSIRFQAMARSKNEQWFKQLMESLAVTTTSTAAADKSRRLVFKELTSSVTKLRDPLRATFEASSADVFAAHKHEVDADWMAMRDFMMEVARDGSSNSSSNSNGGRPWNKADADELAHAFARKWLDAPSSSSSSSSSPTTSEYVLVRCTQLAVGMLGTRWERDAAARVVMGAFVARMAGAQSELAQKYRQELQAALDTTSEEFQRKLILIAAQDLLEPNRWSWQSNGHVKRCPNGHMYVIGDCGGAMEVSRCPDCGATVGGTGHNLAAGNEVVRL